MNERTLTAPGTPPGPLSQPHGSLTHEHAAGALVMPNEYKSVNGETTSRLVLVGCVDDMVRSLRSMEAWMKENSNALRVAGVGIEEIRRARNVIARAVPTVHAMAESVVNTRPTGVRR